MILTEKLILSEKLSLYEAVSQEIQDKLKTASEQCLKELKRLMAAQKKDTTRANFDTVIDEIRRNVILSAALMNNSTADIEDKKRGLADFKELLAKLKNMPELSTIDNNIVVQINDIYNNINSLATSTPSENTFDTAGDEIERMMEITATLRTHTDGDTTVDDSAIDDCWSLMKMALALSEYVDTDLTDKTITSLINDIDTLTRDLRAISADKLADGKQLCRDFKNT